MHFKTLARRLFTLAFLAFSLWTLLATSSAHESFSGGTFDITSDCVIPTLEKEVTVANDAVTTAGSSFTDFGFPTATVMLGEDSTGTISTFTRVCSMTYGSTAGSSQEWLYSCYDDGVYTCTIDIHK